MSEDQLIIDANARWLREQRLFFDLSTAKLAEKARAVGRQLGDEIKLSQQLISKYENGGLKTNSRWLGYVQIVFLQICREKGLVDTDVWDLRLPPALDRFFEGQRKRLGLNNPFAEMLGKEDYSSPTSASQPLAENERELVTAARKLAPEEFELLAQLARVLARGAAARAFQKPSELAAPEVHEDRPPATVHDQQRDYKPGYAGPKWGD